MEDLARDQVGSWRREQDRWIERAKRRERAWRWRPVRPGSFRKPSAMRARFLALIPPAAL